MEVSWNLRASCRTPSDGILVVDDQHQREGSWHGGRGTDNRSLAADPVLSGIGDGLHGSAERCSIQAPTRWFDPGRGEVWYSAGLDNEGQERPEPEYRKIDGIQLADGQAELQVEMCRARAMLEQHVRVTRGLLACLEYRVFLSVARIETMNGTGKRTSVFPGFCEVGLVCCGRNQGSLLGALKAWMFDLRENWN
jgi:hypothetical protein